MLPIKLVVFDLAGTTVYDDGSIATAFRETMKAYGYEIPVLDTNPLMGYHKPLAIRMMLEKYEPDNTMISDDRIAEIHARFQDEMVAYYANVPTVKALPFAEEVFAGLRTKDIKIGLNTGFSRKIADTIMMRLGWMQQGVADYLVTSDEVPAGRPHPFMIERMMAMAGITDAKQVVKVGDTEVDVMEGKNAGCLYAIAVTTGAFTMHELLPYEPDFIINGLDELMPILETVS
jgi:phosphonatase-like hydrolase